MNILDDPIEVVLEFICSKNRIVEVIRVSADGYNITYYQPNNGKGYALSDRVLPPTPDKGFETYTYDNLPAKLWKKYVYCARFVDIVSAKTHKVTYYTNEAKCVLMELNSCFEVTFNNGLKIHFLKDTIKIFDQHGLDLTLHATSDLTRHNHDLQKCLEMVKNVRNLYLIMLIYYSYLFEFF